ncbi:MAG: potassium transporter TrkA [Chloroflexus aggregans]|uniref:Potassium transporter TrkA n=1 Tax=Chloroflexus aggregans TaxID=152260 RepID=A0A2J6XEP8_9CHLR|nr:MAG: potassium transporter TrkA [Chloroflexus aggregans]
MAQDIRLTRLKRRRFAFWRLIIANIIDDVRIVREAWFPVSALVLVLGSCTLYLRWFYLPDYCDCQPDTAVALFETLKLLLFQTDLSLPDEIIGRTLFFLTPLLGLFFLLQSAVDVGRLLVDKRTRPEHWQAALAATYRGHMIVCGLGRVGYRAVLQLLDCRREVVAIEANPACEFIPTLISLGVPVIYGDARDPAVLIRAGLRRAQGLIATIDDDLKNVEIALSARRIRPELPTVQRIFSRALDARIERTFGRNSAFSPAALAAPTFAAALMSTTVRYVLDLPAGLLGVAYLTVSNDSPLLGPVAEMEQRFGVRRLPGPSSQFDILPSEELVLVGSLPALEAVQLANRPQRVRRNGGLIVCGLGKVGTQVVRLLIRGDPCPSLTVICTVETPQRYIEVLTAQGVRVLRGDARDSELLREAGIEHASALAALYSDDLLNLQIGLAVRSMYPDVHLVLRVFSDVLADRLADLFGIHTAFSTSALAAPSLVAAALLPDVEAAFDVGDQLLVVRRQIIIDRRVGQTVAELRAAGQLPLSVRRNGDFQWLPPDQFVIECGDELEVLTYLT